ncbi:MAG: DUF1186 domain-containing protein [Planctomycetes bacterium]|nr:DUF1186 domain-containing protein [Planctomycetota bacterium]
MPIDLINEEALREAQIHQHWMAPRLVLALEDAVEAALRDEDYGRNVAAFAVLLLTEFREKEALPAPLDTLSLPDGLSSGLFGDTIVGPLPRVLAAMVDDPAGLNPVIRNPAIDWFIRLAATDTLLYLIREGRITREEGLARLQQHLRNEIEQRDRE